MMRVFSSFCSQAKGDKSSAFRSFAFPRHPHSPPLAEAPAVHTFRVPRSSAFTVIELLVVVVIAFTLLALMGVVWRKIETRNMTTRAQTQLSHLQSALQDYRNEQGCYPPSLAAVSNRLPRAFALFDADGQPLDPWGTTFVYTVNTGGLTYTLFSSGPDGVETNTEDNIHPGRF